MAMRPYLQRHYAHAHNPLITYTINTVNTQARHYVSEVCKRYVILGGTMREADEKSNEEPSGMLWVSLIFTTPISISRRYLLMTSM